MESMGAMAVSTSSANISAYYCCSDRTPTSILCRSGPPAAFLSVSPITFSLQRAGKCSFPLSLSSRHVGARSGGRSLIVSQAKSEDVESVGAAGIGAIGGSLVANPTVWWSLYTLKTTGCGLPPGPGGAIGAIEGVSYLVILGVVGWSVYTKVKTGSGLPPGPFGLLGAVEGISYLSVLAIAVVFGLQALDFGFIPGPLPGKECFG